MRHRIAAAVLVLCACTAKQPHHSNAAAEQLVVEPAPQTYALGTQLGPGGFIPQGETSESFAPGSEVFLSVDVRGASTDQSVEVDWLDGAGGIIGRETKHVPAGAKYVAFSAGKMVREGDYKAVVIIDGRRVTELPFSVGATST